MEQFGIDLDQVLNDFEEQENKKEIENLKVSENDDEPQDNHFNAENIVYQCQSQINESTSEAKISKDCLPSTNNILSSLNKYCKHFLRENVVNHVCCNDSRFLDSSPSEGFPSPGSEDICEAAPSMPIEELDLKQPDVKELDLRRSDVKELDLKHSDVKELLVVPPLSETEGETNSYTNAYSFSQEFSIGSYICIENAKLSTIKDSPNMIDIKEEHVNESEQFLSESGSEILGYIEPSKADKDDFRHQDLSQVDVEVSPASKSKDTEAEINHKESNVSILENSYNEPANSLDIVNRIDEFLIDGDVEEINSNTCHPESDATNDSQDAIEELNALGEELDGYSGSSCENSVVDISVKDNADVKNYECTEVKDSSESEIAVELEKREDYPTEDSDPEDFNVPCPVVDSHEFDEETFVKLSENNCDDTEDVTTPEALIDVGAFNLSNVGDDDNCKNSKDDNHKNGGDDDYKNGDDDDDDDEDVSLKNLRQEAVAFMEEMKNGDIIIANSEDPSNHDYTHMLENINDTLVDEKSLAIAEKLQILLNEEEYHLLDELSKHKHCSSTPEREENVFHDVVLLDDLKDDDDDLITGILSLDADDKVEEEFGRDGITSDDVDRDDVKNLSTEHDPSGDVEILLYDFEREDESKEIPEETFQNEVEVPETTSSDARKANSLPQSRRPIHPGSLHFTQPQFFHAPSRCSNIDLPITELGKVSPTWLPDSSTNKCLQCETPFSFLRRRHHCRACGLVFCNECCNVKYPLEYMNKREERVCCKCFVDFNRASSYQNMLSAMSITTQAPLRPNPHNSSEYCSTISPPFQATPSDPLPPVMVPTGVLRKQGVTRQSTESKQVMFSDGIRPGGDLTHLDERPEGASSSSGSKKKKSAKSSGTLSLNKKQTSKSPKPASYQSSPFWSEGCLPPLVVYSDQVCGNVLDKTTSPVEAFKMATDEDSKQPVMFCLNANLVVHVKVIKKTCCVKRDLWCFSSQGMSTIGQEEVVILMEFNQSETSIPIDIFQAINHVYNSAHSGTPIKNMGSIILPMNDTSQEICGFLFINQTIQCVQNVFLPDPPYLFGIFIKQVELTWARAFPLRLFLRLGAEFRYYPCPLFGVRERPPVYGEVGHTIMNLLADFRNFQYSLSTVDDMVIHVEEKHTTIFIPRHKHHHMLKALSNSDDHVLALAGNFSFAADSHLICTQNHEGSYQTQAMNIQGKLRSVTGASFVVFNGALKIGSGYKAKMSIIEDGLMVQITPEDMTALKQALSSAEDFTIKCGLTSVTQPSSPGGEGVFDGVVSLTWFSEQVEKSSDLKSPIDNLNLTHLEYKRIHSSVVHAVSGEGFAIVWTGLFFLNASCASLNLRPEIERFSDTIATSCCISLTPHIASLFPPPFSKLALRIKVSPDQIGYETRINGSQLNEECLIALDNVIIPLLHGSSFAARPYDTSLELLFIVTKPINA